MRLPVLETLSIALALFSAGCARNYVSRGAELYAGGNYVEAALLFERTETRLASASPDERARYGLYRGVTFQALGDVHGAKRWLAYSESTLRKERAELSSDEKNLLGFSLREITGEEADPPVSEPAVAASRKSRP